MKEIIEKGTIGKIRFVHIQLFKSPSEDEIEGKLSWRIDPLISGGGHFFDLASHQLDYLDFLFGPVKIIKSLVLNQGGFYKAEDFVSAQFLFAENICCCGTWSFASAMEAGRDVIEIIGENGYIRFSCFNFEPIILETSNGRQEFVNERPENVQIYLIDQVVKAIMGKGNAVSTGNTAARTSWVMDEVVKEYYKKI